MKQQRLVPEPLILVLAFLPIQEQEQQAGGAVGVGRG